MKQVTMILAGVALAWGMAGASAAQPAEAPILLAQAGGSPGTGTPPANRPPAQLRPPPGSGDAAKPPAGGSEPLPGSVPPIAGAPEPLPSKLPPVAGAPEPLPQERAPAPGAAEPVPG